MRKLRSLITVLQDKPILVAAPSFVIVRADAHRHPPPPGSRPLHLHVVRRPDDPVLTQATEPPRQRYASRSMAAHGDIGLFALTERDEVVGWTWICPVSFRDSTSGLRSRLASDETWNYDTRALRTAYHGLRAADFLLAEVSRVTREEFDGRYWYSAIETTNDRSLRLFERSGTVEVQRVRTINLLQQRGIQVPFSARPAHGPCSRRGRHRTRQASPR
jgi:hypothetical protein